MGTDVEISNPTAYPTSTSLCQPHFAMWCQAKGARIKFTQGGAGWLNNPINYYVVPGQHTSLLSLHDSIYYNPCHPGHQWWVAKLLGISPSFCEDVWFMGDVNRQWKAGYGTYPQIEEYVSPGSGPIAPGVKKLLPEINCGDGQTCPPKPDPCCKDGGKGGPSTKMQTPFWSKDFEDFILQNMGRASSECTRDYLEDEPHDCAKILETKNTPKMSSGGALGCGSPGPTDCTGGCAPDRNLKAGSSTNFDRPPSKNGASSSTWSKIGGAHLAKSYDAWSFSEYSMKYTNIKDPTSESACESPGTWDITWYQTGVKREEVPDGCPPGGPTQRAVVKHMTAMHDLNGMPHYDPCWIGWTGGSKGGQKSVTAKGDFSDCPGDGNTVDNIDGDGTQGAILPPVEYMEIEGYEDADGDGVKEKPVWGSYWHRPKHRLFDYWALTGNQKVCSNPNVGKDTGKNDFFLQHTVYFDDSSFMSISLPNNPPACGPNQFVQGWPNPCVGAEPQWKIGCPDCEEEEDDEGGDEGGDGDE